jgi:hypothetical protein
MALLTKHLSFSPNGHVVLYAHKINGSGELSTVSIDGVVRQSFNIHADDIREPAWVPFDKKLTYGDLENEKITITRITTFIIFRGCSSTPINDAS